MTVKPAIRIHIVDDEDPALLVVALKMFYAQRITDIFGAPQFDFIFHWSRTMEEGLSVTMNDFDATILSGKLPSSTVDGVIANTEDPMITANYVPRYSAPVVFLAESSEDGLKERVESLGGHFLVKDLSEDMEKLPAVILDIVIESKERKLLASIS